MNTNERMAVEVMGWHKAYILCETCSEDCEGIEHWCDVDNNTIIACIEWHPDTDIGQAMRCWKEAKVRMYISFDPDDPDVFWVTRRVSKLENRVKTATLEKLPLAICEAILQATK